MKTFEFILYKIMTLAAGLTILITSPIHITYVLIAYTDDMRGMFRYLRFCNRVFKMGFLCWRIERMEKLIDELFPDDV